jgi:DNA-binding phage protein
MQQKVQGLNKEFKKTDVNRMRNLIQGKGTTSTGNQIGYSKKTEDYKEGDVWKENKKTWTIKNGIKQTISKLDAIKKEVFMPLCCPKCSKVMKKRLDKPNYKIHKTCFDCVIEFEHKLRIRGEYDDYIKKLEAKNSLNIVGEMESYLLDAINTSNEGFVSEDGVVERWKGGIDKKDFSSKIRKAAKIRREHIEKTLNDEERA